MPRRQALGAVNTMLNADGRLIGDNTDAPGSGAGWREVDIDPRGHARRRCLGAGGAARAVARALAEAERRRDVRS